MRIKLPAFSLVAILFSVFTYGQQLEFSGNASVLGLSGTDEELPFWMYHNTFGRIEANTNAFTLLNANVGKGFGENSYLEVGGGVLYNDGLERQVRADEWYLSYQYKWLGFEGGKKQPIENYDGIASVNTDMIWNNNARPRPGVRLFTAHPVALTKSKRLLFEAEYGDYFLDDERYVEGARFHGKSLAFLYRFDKGWQVKGGLRHTVMWGGNSPRFGQQPEGFGDYLRAVFSLPGGEGATESDQINTLGNAVSGYFFHLSKNWQNWYGEFIWNNLQEDSSGRNLSNLPDGRYALYLKNKKEQHWFRSAIYEFIYTKSQSAWADDFSADDDYFNNGQYPGGYTYNGMIIGTPFFLLSPNEDGVYSNRIVVHHFGGLIGVGNFNFRGRVSFRKNYSSPGRAYYGEPYNGPKNIISGDLQVTWRNAFTPLHFWVAADHSNINDNGAVGIGLSRSW
ncbi:hypothetical protein E7Z59_08660 [Robertkochia marina]|uniref:Capsule assembly Wzi family protein n=1 Tax=Robertkochia marina TaxID=1227945 RepID=A0A4V6RRT2_9FLAO|nr:capsule assembly Wzi family protein [Robertkochia marina]THD67716.1 hypothetical protein E7Z59_08660 [Robertkochia marina]TRZ43447.1 hypothetical protein D3A96_10805 [Robertkochia marina]